MAGVLNEVRQSGAHAPNFPVTVCDKYTEALVVDNSLHVWEAVTRDVIDGKERAETYA